MHELILLDIANGRTLESLRWEYSDDDIAAALSVGHIVFDDDDPFAEIW